MHLKTPDLSVLQLNDKSVNNAARTQKLKHRTQVRLQSKTKFRNFVWDSMKSLKISLNRNLKFQCQRPLHQQLENNNREDNKELNKLRGESMKWEIGWIEIEKYFKYIMNAYDNFKLYLLLLFIFRLFLSFCWYFRKNF